MRKRSQERLSHYWKLHNWWTAEPELKPTRSGPEDSNFPASHTTVTPVREIALSHRFLTHCCTWQRDSPPGALLLTVPLHLIRLIHMEKGQISLRTLEHTSVGTGRLLKPFPSMLSGGGPGSMCIGHNKDNWGNKRSSKADIVCSVRNRSPSLCSCR